MNVVEAIDAWIDDRIDDLSDAELEEILDLVDLLADSEFAGLDADGVDDDDIDDMVALVDGGDEQINYAHWVLSNALIGVEDPLAGYLDASADTSHPDPDTLRFEFDTPLFAAGAGDLAAVGADEYVDAAADVDAVEPVGDNEPIFARFDREIRGAVGAESGPADQPDETDNTDTTDTTDTTGEGDQVGNGRGRTFDPIVLVPAADGLGPSFLPPIEFAPQAPVRNDSWKRWTVASLIIAGLAIFAYGTVQLIGSLGETSVASTSTATTEGGDDAQSPLTSNAAATTSADSAGSSASSEAGTPAAEARPATQTALVLSDGSIVLATAGSPESEAPPEFATLYEPNAAENLGAALRASWSDDELGVVDSSGNVHIIDPSADSDAVSTIYVADDDLAPAIAMAAAGPQVVILTDDGSVWLMEKSDTASARTLTQLWDAEEEQAQVTSITATADQLAFTLDTGDAKLMNIATARNTITDLWSSTGDAPAPRIENGPDNTLLWIWEGAISRYRLDAGDDARVEVVWDPSTVDEKPAIRFSPLGDRFAVILQDGGMVLATEGGAAQKLWDPAETELRAQSISASANEIIMLLDTGSVLRMVLDVDPPRLGAIWDVTDETLSPARQVAVRP